MGGGTAKAHESFVVSPALELGEDPDEPVVPNGLQPVTDEDLDAMVAPTGPVGEALAAFDQAIAEASSALEGGEESAAQYRALKAAVEVAAAELVMAEIEGLPAQLVAEYQAQVKATTKQYLSGLDADQLAALAGAEGFEHPGLVGLNTPPGGPHPLAHWLDPAYPAGIASKLGIQAKASERYAALAAGATIGGLTLADVQAAEAGLQPPPLPGGSWAATPADVVKASAQLHQALADYDPKQASTPSSGGSDDGGLGALLAAENHLARAQCTELGGDLDVAKASAKALVDKSLEASYGYQHSWALGHVVAAAQADGTFSEAEAKYLSRTEQLALLRASTAAIERAGLSELSATRAAELASFVELKAAYGAYPNAGGVLGLAGADSGPGKDGVVAFAKAAGDYYDQRAKVVSWSPTVAASSELIATTGNVWGSGQAELTTTFRSWAKDQKLADLRSVATALGMPAGCGSRAQVQNYIAASWDPSLDKPAITAAATKGPAPKPKPAPKPAAGASTPPAPSTSPGPGTTPAGPPTARSFAAKHLQIVQALKAHQALAADLPARPPAAAVDSWAFGPAQASHLGGGHTKSLHTAPDGSVWMFKPDKTAAGARAHAEARASEIFSRVGVPSVAVYARKIGGKMGSIQPLVEGASTLSGDPASWSQTDVDNLVRYHVAAWAVGDHDGNPANVIRTPSGGLCPVDQGQAFKFFGRDKLSVDYHPNDSFGSIPVFHQAYGAAKAGNLAKGVTVRPEAALPTIKAFEAMPEAAYRAILAPVATEGAARGVHWVEPMRKAAQKRLGKATVSNNEVAEEFLRTAVERKNGLRSAFASFFGANGFGAGAKLEKVA